MAVLIDSSVWISAAHPKTTEYKLLGQLIKKNELIYITLPIQVEVCQGARTEEQFRKLWDSFLGFDFLEITERAWRRAAWNYFRLRKKGKTLSTMDVLIGTLSLEYGVALWTLDKSLRDASSTIGFDLFT